MVFRRETLRKILEINHGGLESEIYFIRRVITMQSNGLVEV